MKGLGIFAAGFLAACALSSPALAGPTPGAAAFEDIEWKLARLGTGPVALGQRRDEPSLVLRSEGRRVSGFTGCNQLVGRYLIHRHKLILGQLVATQGICPGRMATETEFINTLHRVRTWSMAGERLTLFDTDGRPLAVFEEAGPAP